MDIFGVPKALQTNEPKIVMHYMLLNYPDDPSNEWWYEHPNDTMACVSEDNTHVAQKADKIVTVETAKVDQHVYMTLWTPTTPTPPRPPERGRKSAYDRSQEWGNSWNDGQTQKLQNQ